MNLLPRDMEMFAKFHIPESLVEAAKIERVDDSDARERFGIRTSGDMAGLIFPYYLTNSNGHRVTARLRRDHPDVEDGKPKRKYVSPYGDRPHLYFPPGAKELLDDATVPIVLVEAEKSVLTLMALAERVDKRILPVGLGGVWGWRGRIGKAATPDGCGADEVGPLPDLAYFSAGRTVCVLFDSNVATNPKVQAARNALIAVLRKQKADVRVLDLPAVDGVNGPDDFIAIRGDDAMLKVFERAEKPVPMIGPACETGHGVELLSQSFTDYGNALRLLAVHGEHLRYFSARKKWLIWDGVHYRIDEQDEIRKLTQGVMLAFTEQAAANQHKEAARFALGSCLNTHRISSAIREAQPLVPVTPDELDGDPDLLNFQNGVLDFNSFELLPHSPERLITKLVHFDYKPRSSCPRFCAFVERILGPLATYVQSAIGYTVTGVTSEKVAFLCYGPTNSGKTTFLELFRHLFAEYSTLIMVDALMLRSQEDNNSLADLADLRGCRFAMTSETEEGQRLKEGKLKRIVQGQGMIKSARKYENPIQFCETHKLWIDTNHKPLIRGSDDAIWGRLVIIPFERPLSNSEVDPHLPAKLREEAEGIIAWTIEGTRRWRQEGLGKVPQIDAARSEWRAEMDPIGRFLENCCVLKPEISSAARPLYQEYRRWTSEVGEPPMTETMFGRRMAEKFEKKKDGHVVYRGVGLKSDCEQEVIR
jgi:putative DNA primase/helicase